MTEKQLIDLLNQYSPAIRDAILAGIRDVRDNALLSQIITMIEQRNIDGALRALGYNPAVFNGYFTSIMQAFQSGGTAVIANFPRYTPDATGVRSVIRFNMRDPRAEQWLREHSTAFVTGIEDDIRQAVRETIADGFDQGRNPRNIALDIVGRFDRSTGHREGGVVGLGDRERFWARSARQKLLTLDPTYFSLELRDKRFDPTVRAAIDAGRPLPSGVIDKLVDRYRANALRHRGETIGRTEALAALNRSEYEATKQALDQSSLPPQAARKVWDSAGDNRVRDSHRALDGQSVGIDDAFVSPVTGAQMLHPGDTSLGAGGRDVISCRCRVRYDIDFAYGVS